MAKRYQIEKFREVALEGGTDDPKALSTRC